MLSDREEIDHGFAWKTVSGDILARTFDRRRANVAKLAEATTLDEPLDGDVVAVERVYIGMGDYEMFEVEE